MVNQPHEIRIVHIEELNPISKQKVLDQVEAWDEEKKKQFKGYAKVTLGVAAMKCQDCEVQEK